MCSNSSYLFARACLLSLSLIAESVCVLTQGHSEDVTMSSLGLFGNSVLLLLTSVLNINPFLKTNFNDIMNTAATVLCENTRMPELQVLTLQISVIERLFNVLKQTSLVRGVHIWW